LSDTVGEPPLDKISEEARLLPTRRSFFAVLIGSIRALMHFHH
jgi:hypothetical protein